MLRQMRGSVYIALVLVAALAGFAYAARVSGLFACQPVEPGSDQYIGLCDVTGFGDYDHGALWFGLERQAVDAASGADILFVGNSRMQAGLSTNYTDHWFDDRQISYFLFGFSHDENYRFVQPALDKLEAGASLYVVNVDNFFDDRLTGPANSAMNEPDSFNRYRQKHFWQKMHNLVCGTIAGVCGGANSIVRNRPNGAWKFRVPKHDRTPVVYDRSVDQGLLRTYERRADQFLQDLNASSSCIVLTVIPDSAMTIASGRALAERLNFPFVAPELDDLTTFDTSHLDEESAARWSMAFMFELEPYVDRCIGGAST